MSHPQFTPAFNGNNTRTRISTPSTMNAGLNLPTVEHNGSAFAFTSYPNSTFPPYITPVAQMFSAWQPGALPGYYDMENLFSESEQQGGHDYIGSQFLGGQEPAGFTEATATRLGNINNFATPAHFFPDTNLAAETATVEYAEDVGGEHDVDGHGGHDFHDDGEHDFADHGERDSDVDQHASPADEEQENEASGKDDSNTQYPTPPADIMAPKKRMTRASSKKAAGNKTAPNSNKVTKTQKKDEMTPAEKLAEKVKKYFSDKMKKAGLIIREQKKQTDPASQLGANVSIVDSANGVTITGVYWKAPTNDDTIPSTQAQINKCVQKLVEAIRNNHECREKDDSKIFQNRWADSATYYTVPEMKAVAQEVMTTMIDVHRNGWTKSIYDKEQRDLLQKTMLFTFKERFDCLVELLMCSKTTCQDLMKGERHYSIIGNPYALTNRTKSNKASNETKEVRIADGAEVESLRRAANGEESLPKAKGKKRAREEDENDVQARLVVAAKPPNKRARKNVQ